MGTRTHSIRGISLGVGHGDGVELEGEEFLRGELFADDHAFSLGVADLQDGDVGESDELGTVGDLELLADGFAMAVHCRDCAAQYLGDVLLAVTLAHEGEHFELSVGEDIETAEVVAIGDDCVVLFQVVEQPVVVGRDNELDNHEEQAFSLPVKGDRDGLDACAEPEAAENLDDEQVTPLVGGSVEQSDPFIGPLVVCDIVQRVPDDGFWVVVLEVGACVAVGVDDLPLRGEQQQRERVEPFAECAEQLRARYRCDTPLGVQ